MNLTGRIKVAKILGTEWTYANAQFSDGSENFVRKVAVGVWEVEINTVVGYSTWGKPYVQHLRKPRITRCTTEAELREAID